MKNILLILVGLALLPGVGHARAYSWLASYDTSQTIEQRISVPEGYVRTAVDSTGFAHWLRHLPLKAAGTPVLLHNGSHKTNQAAHVAVIDIDRGSRDLQQCADAVIRLRAEYLYGRGLYDSIVFNFTSGDPARYRDWIRGLRPRVRGNTVTWEQKAAVDSSYAGFRKYLDVVFTYAGTLSLRRELKPKTSLDDIVGGDVLIQGGSPGHAVLVVDVAVDTADGQRVFLLVQSYMPAQDIHVLKNPADVRLSPWYSTECGEVLPTPEWLFRPSDLKAFGTSR